MEQVEMLGLQIYPVSLAVTLLGAVICFVWTLARLRGQKGGMAAAVLGMLCGTVLGRVCWCLCDYEWLESEGVRYFVSLNDGGWMPVGMLLGVTLGAMLAAKLCRAPFGSLVDGFAAPVLLYAALLHAASGLAGEGYGWGVDDWFAPDGGMSVISLSDTSALHRMPFAVSNYYGEWRWAVFVLMAVLLLVLCVLVQRARVSRSGGRWTLALLLYACVTILGESLRQDEMVKWGFVRCAQLLCALLTAGIFILCAVKSGMGARRIVPRAVQLLAGAGLVIMMEFALEGKISAIEWMTMDICYLIDVIACALMALAVLPLWRKAFAA